MKPVDFYKIMADFVVEDKRWRALKIGDTVYDSPVLGRGNKVDYLKAIIKEINVDERFIIVDDLSRIPVVERKYYRFTTQAEFKKLKL